jgi:hypothetical protein
MRYKYDKHSEMFLYSREIDFAHVYTIFHKDDTPAVYYWAVRITWKILWFRVRLNCRRLQLRTTPSPLNPEEPTSIIGFVCIICSVNFFRLNGAPLGLCHASSSDTKDYQFRLLCSVDRVRHHAPATCLGARLSRTRYIRMLARRRSVISTASSSSTTFDQASHD